MRQKYDLIIECNALAQPLTNEMVDAIHALIYHRMHERFPRTFDKDPALQSLSISIDPQHVSKLRLLAPYAVGVVTTPLWFYIFRRQLAKILVPMLSDKELDESLFKFMQARLDYQDKNQKTEKKKDEQK
jgi:hypothetical protein